MNVRALFVIACAASVLALAGLVACAPAAPPNPTTAAPGPVAGTTPAGIPVTGAKATATPGGPANSLIKVARIQGFGLFLTDDAGRTLYAFAKDTNNASSCTGTCVQNWPPFTAVSAPQVDSPLDAKLVTLITRDDGTMQVSYDGHPLYYYSGDKNLGDVKGHGIGNVWHVLSPRGSPMTNPPPPTATTAPY